jgi:DNA polymerase-3 subunit gamma/tau
MRILSRAWQLLTRGIGEVQASPRPIAAAEMVLIRLAYAADLPTPDEALKVLASGGAVGAGSSAPSGGGGGGGARAMGGGGGPSLSVASRAEPAPVPRPVQEQAPAVRLARFEDLVALAGEKRDITIRIALERDVRLVRFEDGRLEFAAEQGASPTLAADLSKRLSEWTGRRWIVALSSEPGQQTLREKQDAEAAERLTGVRADPLVRAVLARFPGAEIVAIRDIAAESAGDAPEIGSDVPAEPPIDDDGYDFEGLDLEVFDDR